MGSRLCRFLGGIFACQNTIVVFGKDVSGFERGDQATNRRATTPIRRAIIGTVAADGFLLVLGMLSGVITARLLLAEGRGALAAVLFWPQLLAGLGLLSLNEAATYRIGAARSRRTSAITAYFWLALALAFVTTGAGYVLVPLLLRDGRAHLWALARMYLIYIPFNFVTLGLLAGDQAKLQFARYNVVRVVVPVTYLLGLLALWATRQISVASVVAINCAGSIVVAVVVLALQRPAIVEMPSWTEMRALLTLATRFHPATIVLLVASQADQFIVLHLWDDAAVGRYVVALAIASTGLALVSGPFQKVLFPHLANAPSRAAQVELFIRGLCHASLSLVAVCTVLAVLTPWVVPSLFGPSFADAVGLAWVLLGAYLLVALKTIVIQALRGLGEGRSGWIAAALSLTIFMIVAWPLGKTLGLIGIGVGLGLANVGALAYLGYDLRFRCGVRFADFRRIALDRRAVWTAAAPARATAPTSR